MQDEGRIAEMISDALLEHDDLVRQVESFADRGVLTSNTGFVVTMDDGSEFQVTVLRSR